MINRERITKEFCDLVAIDSVPFQERKMADTLMERLKELGFEVTEDNTGKEIYQGSCGNV